MVSAIAAAARYFSHGSARVFLPSGYRALVKRCNLLRGASGRERHSNPPALCSFDFYGLKLAMKPSKFHYKIFELHSLHNKTLFRKFWLYYTMFYPWNATVLRHKLFNSTQHATTKHEPFQLNLSQNMSQFKALSAKK